jgi:hypothetical protein
VINVVNVRTHVKTKYDHYIGRPSILGNPFPITSKCTREQSVSQYKDYFKKRMSIEPFESDFWKEINWIWRAGKEHDVNLVCYCSPLPCHGDVIKAYLEGRING